MVTNFRTKEIDYTWFGILTIPREDSSSSALAFSTSFRGQGLRDQCSRPPGRP